MAITFNAERERNPDVDWQPMSGKSLTNTLIKGRVLIVHGMALARFGLRVLLEKSERFDVCAETDHAPTALEFFLRHRPNVVVLGLTLRGGDGIQLIKDLRKVEKNVAAVVLSTREDALSTQRAFHAGAAGYLIGSDHPEQVLRALDEISAGRPCLSTTLLPQLLRNHANGRTPNDQSGISKLSDRELEIFFLIGQSFGPSRIARELHVSVKTVETHETRMREKLGLDSAAGLREKATRFLLNQAEKR
jgi:DNA-binding NarL/FixJ family response regulator